MNAIKGNLDVNAEDIYPIYEVIANNLIIQPSTDLPNPPRIMFLVNLCVGKDFRERGIKRNVKSSLQIGIQAYECTVSYDLGLTQ
jgi:hypothetical protein